MILTVIDRTMLDKIISMQKKYPHAVFILENESGEPIPDAYKPYIAAEIRKMDDLEALVGQIYSENENRRFDGSRMPRFNDKQTLLNYGNS